MSYPKRGNHIRDKVKVVLDLQTMLLKEQLNHATGVNTSDLAAKKILLI